MSASTGTSSAATSPLELLAVAEECTTVQLGGADAREIRPCFFKPSLRQVAPIPARESVSWWSPGLKPKQADQNIQAETRSHAGVVSDGKKFKRQSLQELALKEKVGMLIHRIDQE